MRSRLALAASIAALALAAPALPANAVPGGWPPANQGTLTVAAPDRTAPKYGCKSFDVRVKVDMVNASDTWMVFGDVAPIDPYANNFRHEITAPVKGKGDKTVTLRHWVCGSDPAGTYTWFAIAHVNGNSYHPIATSDEWTLTAAR